MSRIVLNSEQLAAIENERGRLPVCRPDGKVFGLIAPYAMEGKPFSAAEIAEAERGFDDPNTKWYTTKEVLEHLRSLESG
jgi:hypothetical protein